MNTIFLPQNQIRTGGVFPWSTPTSAANNNKKFKTIDQFKTIGSDKIDQCSCINLT